MNKRPLCLALSLLLASVSIVSAASRDTSAPQRATKAAISIPAVVPILKSATPGSLRALGATGRGDLAAAVRLLAGGGIKFFSWREARWALIGEALAEPDTPYAPIRAVHSSGDYQRALVA